LTQPIRKFSNGAQQPIIYLVAVWFIGTFFGTRKMSLTFSFSAGNGAGGWLGKTGEAQSAPPCFRRAVRFGLDYGKADGLA